MHLMKILHSRCYKQRLKNNWHQGYSVTKGRLFYIIIFLSLGSRLFYIIIFLSLGSRLFYIIIFLSSPVPSTHSYVRLCWHAVYVTDISDNLNTWPATGSCYQFSWRKHAWLSMGIKPMTLARFRCHKLYSLV